MTHPLVQRRLDRRRGIKAKRSSEWRSVEKANRQDACEACGKTKKLEVHHKRPFHLHPELELDPDNLITLCRRCHQLIGHLDDWKSFNPGVDDDAEEWLRKIEHRPEGDEEEAA